MIAEGVYPAIQGNGMYTGNVSLTDSSVSATGQEFAIYWPQNGTLTYGP
jgi:hypothetical protein